MPTRKKLKQYALDENKVKRVQEFLGAKTEREAIEKALEAFLVEEKLERSHRKFVESKGQFIDTLGRMAR
jgi:hypothetical protein